MWKIGRLSWKSKKQNLAHPLLHYVNVNPFFEYQPAAIAAIENKGLKGILYYLMLFSYFLNERISVDRFIFSEKIQGLKQKFYSYSERNSMADSLTNKIKLTNELETIAGYSQAYFCHEQTWESIIHHEDIRGYRDAWSKLTEDNILNHKYRIFHSTGNVMWVQDKILPAYDSSTNLLYFERTVLNISIQKEFEACMKHEEA